MLSNIGQKLLPMSPCTLFMANYFSRGYGQVIETTAMGVPVEIVEGSAVDGSFTGEL
jgi:hypothetical protein